MDLENYTNVNIYKKVFEKREVSSIGNVIEQPHHKTQCATEHAKGGFNPYVNNQGTTVAVAGKDFVLVAADTRISQGYNILSRDYSRTTRLTDQCVITSSGMVADIETLHKLLIAKVKIYERQFKKSPTVESLAQLLGNTLYGRRFMPYYAFNLLCGINQQGEGVVYGYDAIGSYDKLTYGVQGSGSELGAPILDNQFIGHNYLVKVLAQDLQTVEETAKDIINSIAERDIYTGDQVEVVIVDKNGVRAKKEPIRRD